MKKILIVDDEAPIRETLQRYFAKRGLEVECADSGWNAIQKFKEFQPELVLLDILMPGLTGVETLSALRGISTSFKAVMITAVKDEGTFKKCRELGASDYILKPFDLAYLDAQIFGKFFG